MRKCRFQVRDIFKLSIKGNTRVCVWLGNNKACDNTGNIFSMPMELVDEVSKDIKVSAELEKAFNNVVDRYNTYLSYMLECSGRQYAYMKENKYKDEYVEDLLLACEEAKYRLQGACTHLAKLGIIYEDKLSVANLECLVKSLADSIKLAQIDKVDNKRAGISVMTDIQGNIVTFVLQIRSSDTLLNILRCDSFYSDIEPYLIMYRLSFNLGTPVTDIQDKLVIVTHTLQIAITGDEDFRKLKRIAEEVKERSVATI